MQWITLLSFAFGILLASMIHLPMFWLIVALAVGFLAQFLYRYVHVLSNPWYTFAWNVAVMGAIWFNVRAEYSFSDSSGEEKSFIEAVSQRTASYARDCLVRGGVSEDDATVLGAMLLGDRKSLSREQKMRFREAGVQHLLALSGLHLGIFIGVFSFLFLRRARISRRKWTILFAVLAVLWTYCVVAGMPRSLLRAMIMASLYYLSYFAYSYSRVDVNLATTALIMLLIDPSALFDVGTLLSFSAVGALIWLYPILKSIAYYDPAVKHTRVKRIAYRVWQLACISFAAWLGTMPLCLYFFHQFQPWQPIASILLVPMTTLLLYIAAVFLVLCLLHCWLLASPLALLLTWYMKVENAVLDAAGALPGSTIYRSDMHFGHVLLLYLLFCAMAIGLEGTMKVKWMSLFVMLFTLLVLFLV